MKSSIGCLHDSVQQQLFYLSSRECPARADQSLVLHGRNCAFLTPVPVQRQIVRRQRINILLLGKLGLLRCRIAQLVHMRGKMVKDGLCTRLN